MHSIAVVVYTPETVSSKVAFSLIGALSHSGVGSGGSTLILSFVVHRLAFARAWEKIFNFFVKVFEKHLCHGKADVVLIAFLK